MRTSMAAISSRISTAWDAAACLSGLSGLGMARFLIWMAVVESLREAWSLFGCLGGAYGWMDSGAGRADGRRL